MIKNMRNKGADMRYRHDYLILHGYSDAFECYIYMTYDITLVQKSLLLDTSHILVKHEAKFVEDGIFFFFFFQRKCFDISCESSALHEMSRRVFFIKN